MLARASATSVPVTGAIVCIATPAGSTAVAVNVEVILLDSQAIISRYFGDSDIKSHRIWGCSRTV